ncbi:MAG: penicillin-binding protein 1C [bacterium]
MKKIGLISLLCPISLILFLLFFPLPQKLNCSYSKIVRASDGKVLRIFLSTDEKYRIFLPKSAISPLFVQTTITYEDKFFYRHPGINPVSFFRAFYKNIKAKRITQGGSTITMQLARILEPKPRTIKNKLIEIFRAFQLELHFSKDKILELYLNLAPYGGNIEGIGAASISYYGRLPDNLTPAEVAFLVSLPQRPHKSSPQKVLKIMLSKKLISKREYDLARVSSFPSKKIPFPFEAPHTCDFLVSRFPQLNDIHSTIDTNIQKKVENILSSYKKKIEEMGASNASVVVMENKTRKIRALIGSLDYFDKENRGQVRGFYAFRSPGSALKPFLYIMAIEDGLINPETLMEDAPYRFENYEPENFSRQFLGLATAEDSLSFSLNLPFILMLKRYGYQKFLNRISEGGLVGPLSPSSYGLPIITGGMDIRLIDLTNLYLTLSRGGFHNEWRLLEDTPTKKEKLLFKPPAVLLGLNALSKRDRPDAPNLALYTIPKKKVYWKTGTSYGRRDGWSLGFDCDYTVGVWVGNFSGEGSDKLIGALIASPIMFDIIRAIGDEKDKKFFWEEPAKTDLETAYVCKFSGYKPSPYCFEKKEVSVLKNNHPYVECPFHKKFIIEKKTGFRASPFKEYKPGELTEKIFLVYPASVQKVLKGNKEPQFPPECRVVEKSNLNVISPVDGEIYFIPKGVRDANFIPLQAFNSCGDIQWFINDKYRGKTKSGEVFQIEPIWGRMKIVVYDDKGENRIIKINVEAEP